MSYILDAIKKSDQQRDLGATPDAPPAIEIPAPPAVEAPRRPGWLYGLAAVLLLHAGGIGWWLWSGPAPKPQVAQNTVQTVVATALPTTAPALPTQQPIKIKPPPTPAPTTSMPPPAEVAMPPEPGKAPPPAGSAAAIPPPVPSSPPPPAPANAAVAGKGSVAPTGAPVTSPATPPVASKTTPPAPPVNQAPPTIPPPPAQPKAPPKAPPKAQPPAAPGEAGGARKNPAPPAPLAAVVPVQTPIPPDTSPEEPLLEEDEPTTAAGEDKGSTADEAEPTEVKDATGTGAPENTLSPIASSSPPKDKAKKRSPDDDSPEIAKIPLVSQLPTEIQQTIPELHISFHSYSIKPASRLVSISGKILREGEAFDETVKLETITSQGVVMAVKDRRFRLKVNPSAR